MSAEATAATRPEVGPASTAAARGFAALRIFTGVMWLSNGLAKLTGTAQYDWGFLAFNLITGDAARSILTGASANTPLAPLGAFYRDAVLPNWGFFGPFLTGTELVIGLGLVFGVLSRLAALGGLALLTPIWAMMWPQVGYFWTYPAEDLFPLLLLVIVPAGRVAGLDRLIAPRLGHRWPT